VHITNLISKGFGYIARYKFPSLIQHYINTQYIKHFKIDLGEFDEVHTYKTLNQLFTRSFKIPRLFNTDKNILIAPADSRIYEIAKVKEKLLYQIKGKSYDLEELLTDFASYTPKCVNGDYVNFYLSPSDYHRYHAPFDLRVHKIIHVGGALYPVNKKYLNKVDSLFVKNERVILECLTQDEKVVYLIFIGALNVGSMFFAMEPQIQTNDREISTAVYYKADVKISKGEEIGYFKMGSTVVMITEPDLFAYDLSIEQKVKFGDTIGVRKA
jgi:phosphatidylserine decarboxylase